MRYPKVIQTVSYSAEPQILNAIMLCFLTKIGGTTLPIIIKMQAIIGGLRLLITREF